MHTSTHRLRKDMHRLVDVLPLRQGPQRRVNQLDAAVANDEELVVVLGIAHDAVKAADARVQRACERVKGLVVGCTVRRHEPRRLHVARVVVLGLRCEMGGMRGAVVLQGWRCDRVSFSTLEQQGRRGQSVLFAITMLCFPHPLRPPRGGNSRGQSQSQARRSGW